MGAIWESVKGFFGGLFDNVGAPSSWPSWVFAGLALLAIMGLAVYAWNRLGKGLLFVIMGLVLIVIVAVMR